MEYSNNIPRNGTPITGLRSIRWDFCFIGLSPNTNFLESTVELDPRKFVVTNINLETSGHGIFAVGDCRKNAVNQVVAAAGEGAAAVIHIRGFLQGSK